MKSQAIGRAGLRAPVLSFGTAPIANLLREVSDEDAASAIAAAWETGSRYFDTAPHYGLGLGEKRLGEVLSQFPREDYILSTKVGRLIEPTSDYPGDNDLADGFMVPKDYVRVYDYSADGTKRSIEASMERLGVDRIDIVYVHDADDHYREALDGALPALSALRDEGVISSFGAGMNQAEMITEFVRHSDLDVVMLAGRYTLLEQGALDNLLPLATERQVSIVAAGVFNSGLLAKNRPDENTTYNYAPAPAHIIERVNAIADICELHGVDLPEAAAQFPLGHPTVANVCLGARNGDQVRRNAGLFDKQIPSQMWRELVSAGFVRSESVHAFVNE